MATLTNTPGQTGPDDGVVIARATHAQRREALGVLLTGRIKGSEAVVEHFLEFAAQHRLSLEELWVASDRGRIAAAVLLVPSAGRAAMIFVSPGGHGPGFVKLVRTALGAQQLSRVKIVQALLEPHQEVEARALAVAGFEKLALLVYMRRRAEARPTPLVLPSDWGAVRRVAWSEKTRPTFERAILASYEDTLDCPGLVGLRDIDEIIAGHMATGKFDPDLWTVLVDEGGEAMAVMLLSPVPQHRALELVYLGVSKPWRGRGLGRRLIEHALGVAHEQGAAHLMLAVDADNAPAVALYDRMCFIPNARKLAMIFALTNRQ